MKKLILSTTILALSLSSWSQTQIGNSGFEQWETSTPELAEPLNWNAFKTASGSLNGQGGQQLNRSTDKRPGSLGTYSARIWTRGVWVVVTTIKANGNMTLGRINMGSTTVTSDDNHNFSDVSTPTHSEAFNDTPDSLVVWVKYKPVNTTAGHQGKVSFVIHKQPTSGNYRDAVDLNSANTIAKAISPINYNSGAWQRMSIPFDYVGTPSQAQYIIGTFASCITPGGGSVNDTLYVDDVSLVYVPKASFTKSATSLCAGTSMNFTSTSTNHPTSYLWTFGDGTTSTQQNPSKSYSTAGTYNVTLTVTNEWGSTTSTSQAVTVNATPSANFSYTQTNYCSTAANQTPTVTTAGTFSASPAGLSINASTGVVNVAASIVGSYTITNAVGGACPDTKTANFVINPASNANFSYSAGTYCADAGAQTPTVTQAGTFTSSPAGLSINASTGVVNLATSTAGTYTVTNTIGGLCPDTKTASITVNAASNSSFAYASNTICNTSGDQTPTINTTGGTFTTSSTDISVDPASGVIDMGNTADGTYTISYAVGGICPSTTNVTVTITASPDATFNYGAATFCTEGTDPLPVFGAGANGGVFTSTTGLELNANSGEIDLAASAPGSYVVTNTIPASGSCPEVDETESITIIATPDAAFSYTTSTYCADETDPTPVFVVGAVAGDFTSTAGLSINPTTGVVDLSASSAGTYVVTNTITGTCSDVETASITINALPTVAVAAFNDLCVYNEEVVLSGATPLGGTYSGTGVNAGSFDPSLVAAGTTVTITYSYTDATTSCSNSATNTIFVDECLGLDENAKSLLVAYPNPSTGKVFIANISETVNYTVVGVAGQVVANGTLTTAANSIDLAAFENGMYVIQLTQNNTQQLIRIVKN